MRCCRNGRDPDRPEPLYVRRTRRLLECRGSPLPRPFWVSDEHEGSSADPARRRAGSRRLLSAGLVGCWRRRPVRPGAVQSQHRGTAHACGQAREGLASSPHPVSRVGRDGQRRAKPAGAALGRLPLQVGHGAPPETAVCRRPWDSGIVVRPDADPARGKRRGELKLVGRCGLVAGRHRGRRDARLDRLGGLCVYPGTVGPRPG